MQSGGSHMKILAIEFSSSCRSVAVARDGVTLSRTAEAGGRTTRAFAMIDSALAQAGLQCGQIDCLAIGLGPGSYAGIRIAIAIAQGWQIALGVKLLGINSAEVVAARAGQSGRADVHIGLDAQRNQIYVARYDASIITSPRMVEPFHPRTPSEVGEVLRMDMPPATATGDTPTWIPQAEILAMLAHHRSDFVPGETLEPIYLRKAEFIKAPPPTFTAF